MAHHKRRFDNHPSQPPMTPMIDVIFQLLIYFLLTMSFTEVEGKLLSQLPKKGTGDASAPPKTEVRVFICAGGDLQTHRNNKGRHSQVVKSNAECHLVVEGHTIGVLYPSETEPEKASGNSGLYRTAGLKSAEIVRQMVAEEIVLDADREVPYEHIIGVFNACKEQGLQNLQFVARPPGP